MKTTRSSRAAARRKGKIVIARYGGGWRGLKPKLAYEHGAIGCLIYSDPTDDGYGRRHLSQGRLASADAVQRGSVLICRFMPAIRSRPALARRNCQALEDGRGADRTQNPGAADFMPMRAAA